MIPYGTILIYFIKGLSIYFLDFNTFGLVVLWNSTFPTMFSHDRLLFSISEYVYSSQEWFIWPTVLIFFHIVIISAVFKKSKYRLRSYDCFSQVEALAVQLTQREGELIQEKAEVKKLANFLKKVMVDIS